MWAALKNSCHPLVIWFSIAQIKNSGSPGAEISHLIADMKMSEGATNTMMNKIIPPRMTGIPFALPLIMP